MTQGYVGLDLLAQTNEPFLCLVEVRLPLQSHDAREGSGFEQQRPYFTTLLLSNPFCSLVSIARPPVCRLALLRDGAVVICVHYKVVPESAYIGDDDRLGREHLSQLLHIRIRQIRPE